MHQLLDMLIEDRSIAMPAQAGETLFIRGDPCSGYLELRRGVARAVRHSRDGNHQVMAFFFPGDRIGLPLAPVQRYTAEAVSDLLYSSRSAVVWQKELASTDRQHNRLLEAVWEEEKAFMIRGLILGRVGTLARMAAFLRMATNRLPERDNVFEFPLPQTDIASYLATSPETVCRSLRQLRELGIISMPRKDRLEVLAPENLSMVAEGL